MGKYSPNDRANALDALQASADDNEGRPRFRQVAGEIGVSHNTLRKWWREGSAGELVDLQVHQGGGRVAAVDDQDGEDFAERMRLSPRDFLVRLGAEALSDAARASEHGSHTAAAKARALVLKIHGELQRLPEEADPDDQLSAEEYADRLREEARELELDDLEIFVAEYMERTGARFVEAG